MNQIKLLRIQFSFLLSAVFILETNGKLKPITKIRCAEGKYGNLECTCPEDPITERYDDPDDPTCDFYWLCHIGKAVKRKCGYQQAFHPMVKDCMARTLIPPMFCKPLVECPVHTNRYVEDPNDCTKYFLCLFGIYSHWSCKDNQYFDPLKQQCLNDKLQADACVTLARQYFHNKFGFEKFKDGPPITSKALDKAKAHLKNHRKKVEKKASITTAKPNITNCVPLPNTSNFTNITNAHIISNTSNTNATNITYCIPTTSNIIPNTNITALSEKMEEKMVEKIVDMVEKQEEKKEEKMVEKVVEMIEEKMDGQKEVTKKDTKEESKEEKMDGKKEVTKKDTNEETKEEKMVEKIVDLIEKQEEKKEEKKEEKMVEKIVEMIEEKMEEKLDGKKEDKQKDTKEETKEEKMVEKIVEMIEEKKHEADERKAKSR